jgi:Tfp pilus assembly protein PilF
MELLDNYSRIIAIDPYNIWARLAKAELLENIDNNPYSALAEYVNILKIDPNNIKALLGRARISEELGHYFQANRDYYQILMIDPTNKIAALALQQL